MGSPLRELLGKPITGRWEPHAGALLSAGFGLSPVGQDQHSSAVENGQRETDQVWARRAGHRGTLALMTRESSAPGQHVVTGSKRRDVQTGKVGKWTLDASPRPALGVGSGWWVLNFGSSKFST